MADDHFFLSLGIGKPSAEQVACAYPAHFSLGFTFINSAVPCKEQVKFLVAL